MKKYLALAYYIFTPIEDPDLEVQKHKKFFEEKDITSRIYISVEGINAQLSGEQEDIKQYIQWLKADSRLSNLTFKIQEIQENIFPRVTVKTRKELVAFGAKVNCSETGEYLAPRQWAEMLETDKEVFIIDVRNDYESQVGHFEGAHLPPLSSFRDFPAYADQLKETLDPQTKVMMYCTGGIRCELFSALLKQKGFEKVYQLEGGVIAYGEKEGSKHWKGKLFVFDDRLAIPLEDSSEPISLCSYCQSPSDTYFNCANMDCNELFLACFCCIEQHLGACSSNCKAASRLRPYDARLGNKPFRRHHLLESQSCSISY